MRQAPHAAATTVLIALALLAGCNSGGPSVLVAEQVSGAAADPSPAAAASSVQLFAHRAGPARASTVTDLGFVDTEQHDVAFGTVRNDDPHVAYVSVTVTTHDDAGQILTQDVTEVRAAGGGSTPFVLDVFPPPGTTVASIEAQHAVRSVEASLDQPAITVRSSTIHDEPINPVLRGTVTSSYPRERTAVPVAAVCVDKDGAEVAAGHGRIPSVAAGGTAWYEIMLFGRTPAQCQVAAS